MPEQSKRENVVYSDTYNSGTKSTSVADVHLYTAEDKRVILQGEQPDYIHAVTVDVRLILLFVCTVCHGLFCMYITHPYTDVIPHDKP